MDEALIKKVMPHSEEAEQSVVGSMIMDSDAIVTAMEILKPEDFYGRQYGILFEAITELFSEAKPADLVTLRDKLKEKDVPPELYGIEFLGNLIRVVPTSANVRYYAQIVKDKAVLRSLIKATESISNQCYLDKEKLEDILAGAEKSIFDIVQRRSSSEFVSIRDIVLQSLDNIEAASRNKGAVTGIATGFYDLDYKTAGLQSSDLILLAARPSMGKTAFVLNIAEHTAIKNNITTAIFSLEMSRTQLVNRMFSMNSRVDAQMLRTGNLEDADWANLMESARVIGESGLIIDDTPGISITELRSKCRKFKLEHNLGLVIIDYLQLM